MMRFFLPLAVLVAGAAMTMSAVPVQATGVIKCKSGPQSGWKTPQALKTKLLAEGWKITKTQADGGCYEVYGTTPQGDRVEAYFHPLTFEKLYVERRGQVLFRKRGY